MHTFELQNSPQTLAEAIAEYYAANPKLVQGRNMSSEAQRFFQCHDAAHVVFGCSTALDDEAIVKIASILGTTAGLGVLKGYRLYESRQIYKQLSLSAVLKSIAHSVVVVPRTVFRCLKQRSRWPWTEFEPYLTVPLRDIRQQFGITVAHNEATS
jgi:ubiquinone biosynthesis protein Coq4